MYLLMEKDLLKYASGSEARALWSCANSYTTIMIIITIIIIKWVVCIPRIVYLIGAPEWLSAAISKDQITQIWHLKETWL